MSQELYSSASSDDQSSINSVVHVPPRSERSDGEDQDSDFSERLQQVCSDTEGSDFERGLNSGIVNDELDNENLEHGDTTTDSEQDSLLSGDRRLRNDSVTSSSSEETQVWVPLRASPKVSGLRGGSQQLHQHSPGMRQSIVSQNSATGRIETALTMEEITGFNGDSGISNESPETQSSGEMSHLHGGHHGSHYGSHYGGTHYPSHLHHMPHSRPSSHMQHTPLSTIPSPPHTPSLPHRGETQVDALRDGPDPLFVSQSEMDGHFRHSLFNMLSGLYALLLIVVGTVLPIAENIADPITTGAFESFYIYLYLISITFLLYVYVFLLRRRNPQACYRRSVASSLHTPEDSLLRSTSRRSGAAGGGGGVVGDYSSAGSFYLRLGAVGFGIGAMIHEGLMFGEVFEYEPVTSCVSLVSIIKPVLHLIFIFIQLYFIFLNSKMCISKYKVFARFGLMHMVATNICVWLRTVVRETVRDVRIATVPSLNGTGTTVVTTPASLLYYGVPQGADVEPNLFISLPNTTDNVSVLVSNTVSPPVVCVRQEIMRQVVDRASPYLYPCTIEYSLIAAGILYLMWNNTGASPAPGFQRTDVNPADYSGTSDSRGGAGVKKSMSSMHVVVDCGGATRGLFLGIFTLVATIISMIVFFVLVERPRYVHVAVAVVHAAELTLHCLAATAVLLAAYKMRDMKFDHRRHGGGATLDEAMLVVSLVGLCLYRTFGAIAGRYNHKDQPHTAGSLLAASSALVLTQASMQAIFVVHALRRSAQKPYHVRAKPGREYVTFLLVCNVAAWGVATLEVPRTRANPLAVDFYGTLAWAIITHVTAPLAVFYRFHSTVCLATIWKNAYKQKLQ